MKNITLKDENVKNLELFQELLHKDKETMINEALELYFTEEYEKLQEAEHSQTNLSYEEFWDDVEI